VEIRYNQNGSSRGIADISFFKAESASKAAKELNGMLVDKRPMKAILYSNLLSRLPAKHY